MRYFPLIVFNWKNLFVFILFICMASCAYVNILKQDSHSGTIWTWGRNNSGSLGDGTKIDKHIPIRHFNLNGIISVAVGSGFTVAAKSDGSVLEWGNNETYSPPNTIINSLIPLKNKYLNDVVAVSGGSRFILALKSNGTVWAWGNNNKGELGNGISGHSIIPTQVLNLNNVKKIATGRFNSIALKSDGTVWTWGVSLVIPDTYYKTPIQIPEVKNIKAISCGNEHFVFLDDTGDVYTFGYRCGYGQLGHGSDYGSRTPKKVQNLSSIIAVSGGGRHSLAVKKDGSVWAWGYNKYGQLGDSSFVKRNKPVKIYGLENIKAVSAGEFHSLALDYDGNVWVWGDNEFGQLGIGTFGKPVNRPVKVKNLKNIISISAGAVHNIVIEGQ